MAKPSNGRMLPAVLHPGGELAGFPLRFVAIRVAVALDTTDRNPHYE